MDNPTLNPLNGVSVVRPPDSPTVGDSTQKHKAEYKQSDYPRRNEDILIMDNRKQLEEQLSQLNGALTDQGKRIEYSVYGETNRIVFKVIDAKTNEVIKEVPSTKLIDFSEAVLERFGLISDYEV